MLHRKGDGVFDLGMRDGGGVHFRWADFLSAPVDRFSDAAGEREKTVLIEHAQVAGPIPAVHERLGIRIGGIFISFEHLRASDDDFPLFLRRKVLTVERPDTDFVVHDLADAAGLADFAGHAIGRDTAGFRG
jgi:hypothetical protein